MVLSASRLLLVAFEDGIEELHDELLLSRGRSLICSNFLWSCDCGPGLLLEERLVSGLRFCAVLTSDVEFREENYRLIDIYEKKKLPVIAKKKAALAARLFLISVLTLRLTVCRGFFLSLFGEEDRGDDWAVGFADLDV